MQAWPTRTRASTRCPRFSGRRISLRSSTSRSRTLGGFWPRVGFPRSDAGGVITSCGPCFSGLSRRKDPVRERVPDIDATPRARPPRPLLGREAHYGLAGEWWAMIAPTTEACDAAVITQFLVLFGNLCGPGPFFTIGPGKVHRANEFLLVVGPSARGAKGDSNADAVLPFRTVEPSWVEQGFRQAINTTAGTIHIIRDASVSTPPRGKPEADPGYQERLRRVVFQLSEFASFIRKFEQPGDTLSATYRNMWDGRRLENNPRNHPASATNYHASLIADVTPEELKHYLDDVEFMNGFLNRFIIVYSERGKLVPTPGQIEREQFDDLCARIRSAATLAEDTQEMARDSATERLWVALYPQLASPPPGRLSNLLSRARPHVLRLSMIYALLDGSAVVRKEHLLGACAVWDYAAESCAWIFDGSTGNRRCDRFISAVRSLGGAAKQGDVHKVLGNNWDRAVYDEVLDQLVEWQMVEVESRRPPGGGRPACWYRLTGHASPGALVERARSLLNASTA